MKYKGVVVDINDPNSLGRIKVKVLAFQQPNDVTPWCYPCSPFAGFSFLPVVGEEVFVEQDYDGDWVYVGYLWTQRNPMPPGASTVSRVLTTKSGHSILLNDNGTLKIKGKDGAEIELSGDKVKINGSSGGGVVCKKHICAYTGNEHPEASDTVEADK